MLKQISLLHASLLPVLSFGAVFHEVSVEQAVDAFTKNITFAGDLSHLSPVEQQAYIKGFNIVDMAKAWVNEPILARTEDEAGMILKAGAIKLEYANMELNRLTVERMFANMLLEMKQSCLLPVLSRDDIQYQTKVVNDVMHATKALTIECIGDDISLHVIDKGIEDAKARLLREINDRSTYWLKHKPDPTTVEHLLNDIKERLDASRERPMRRLAAVRKRAEEERTTKVMKQEYIERMLERESMCVVEEVTREVVSSLHRITSPLLLLKLNENPDQILPGYRALMEKWTLKMNEVLREKMETRIAEMRRAAELRRTQNRLRVMQSEVDDIVGKSVSELPLALIDQSLAEMKQEAANDEPVEQQPLNDGDDTALTQVTKAEEGDVTSPDTTTGFLSANSHRLAFLSVPILAVAAVFVIRASRKKGTGHLD